VLNDGADHSTPHVTVVLAVSQRPEILEVVVEALNNQDYASPWELIVCDDGTAQDMRQVVSAAIDHGRAHLEYVWQQDCGFRVARSRNNGLRLARAPLVICLDGDMVVRPDFVRAHVERHADGKTVVCGTRYWLSVEGTTGDIREQLRVALSSETTEPPSLPTDSRGQASYVGTAWPWLSCISCNFSFDKSTDVWFDEEFVGWGFEDDDFAYRLYAHHGYRVTFAPEAWGLHIESSQPPSSPVRPRTSKEIDLFVRNLRRLVKKHGVAALEPALSCVGQYDFDEESDEERMRADRFASRH